MDVISKEGLLFLQGVKFGKKIWRKSWLILYEPSPAGVGRMELYDMRDGGLKGFATAGLRKSDKRVIRLTDCLSITPAPGESCPTDCSAFFLNTTSCTYTIAAPTREDWVPALCQLAFQKIQGTENDRKVQKDKYVPMADNQLYSTWGAGQFQVAVQSTDASKRCRMSGSYLLSSEKEAISLLDLQTGRAMYRWPYSLLRRFGQVKGGIMIEAGRRCHTGEGQFIFMSKQGPQIHRAIEEAIMHQSVQELLAQATALPQDFPSQPPSPKSKVQDRPKVKNLPPISVTQDRPCPALQCKQGQQMHKAIEEALVHQSLQELLSSSTPNPQATSPKPKTQNKDKTKVSTPLPVGKNQPIHRVIDEVLTHQSVQELLASSRPPQQAPPPPPPLPNSKPRAKPDPKYHPPTNMIQERPCSAVPRKNICLPEPPSSCDKCPVISPDDALYSIIFPQPKPRAKMTLPQVPTPPSLPQQFGVPINPDTGADTEREEWKSVQAPSESSNEEAPYTNWTAKSTGERDQPAVEDLYSTVNFAAKRKNRQTEDGGANADRQTPVITASEIPVDFKQTLSSILFKELSKNTPLVPPRSLEGSCNQLDKIEEQMTDYY